MGEESIWVKRRSAMIIGVCFVWLAGLLDAPLLALLEVNLPIEEGACVTM
jgi:hypothetical protein